MTSIKIACMKLYRKKIQQTVHLKFTFHIIGCLCDDCTFKRHSLVIIQWEVIAEPPDCKTSNPKLSRDMPISKLHLGKPNLSRGCFGISVIPPQIAIMECNGINAVRCRLETCSIQNSVLLERIRCQQNETPNGELYKYKTHWRVVESRKYKIKMQAI